MKLQTIVRQLELFQSNAKPYAEDEFNGRDDL